MHGLLYLPLYVSAYVTHHGETDRSPGSSLLLGKAGDVGGLVVLFVLANGQHISCALRLAVGNDDLVSLHEAHYLYVWPYFRLLAALEVEAQII
jgi:hypothetical protein